MEQLIKVVIPVLFTASVVADTEQVRERIEWIDVWVTDADKFDLPRVLLVGDSITKGYFAAAEKHLKGKAYCARLATSKCVADPGYADDLQLLLKQYNFAVIHINNGLHGWGYSEIQYADGLTKTLKLIDEHAVGAKVIWVTTTPVRDSTDLQTFTARNIRVKERNRIAADIVERNGLPTNDLYGLMVQHPDWHASDGVHFNGKGKDAQAKQVAKSVLRYLPASLVLTDVSVDPAKSD